MFINASLDYYQKWPEGVTWEQFEPLWPCKGEKYDFEKQSFPYGFDRGALIPIQNMQKLIDLGFKVSMKPSNGCMFISEVNRLYSSRGYDVAETLQNGNVTQIHIPNEYLYRINEVKVLDDACTDALQSELDDGWRIICVCPPNSQRRPDYILGRYNQGHR